ncbi:Cox family DNA-binding protein [Escherichia coli]
MKEPAEKALSELVTPELFAEYIGKTPAAIRKMATAGKLPVIRMKDPLNPSKKGGEIYIHRWEWDAYAIHLAQIAPPEWHDWKNRLFTKDKSAR